MANIRLVIPKWAENTGLTHNETDWSISTDLGFTNVVDSHTGNDTNGEKEVWLSNIVVPEGKVYYGKAIRKFTDGSTSEPIGPFAIHAEGNMSSRLTKPPTKITDPVITHNFDYNDDNQHLVTFTISPANILEGKGLHTKTHWYFTTEDGAVIVDSVHDSVNLNKLDVLRDLIPDNNKVRMNVAYRTDDGVESMFTSISIDT